MSNAESIFSAASTPHAAPPIPTPTTHSALRFITCGSVDDGKSTLIGRLLLDSKAVLQDQLAGVQRAGETDLALLTDGLSAEREQGITIDVAWRYFSTPQRKFIIGDAPGHEQYTRNMITAASHADAAVVLVDANKLDWQSPSLSLLPQTRRHALLCHGLRVPSLVFCINKLDAVSQPDVAFAHIRAALEAFAQQAGLQVTAILPISALHGYNVVSSHSGWCGYHGSSLLEVLSALPDAVAHDHVAPACPYAFSVQWVEKNASSSDTQTGRRTFWGLLCSGTLQVGNFVHIVPSGQKARIVRILSPVQGVFEPEQLATAGHSVGLVLDAELDVSRGDWLMAPDAEPPTRHMHATVAWMDTQPLVSGRMYWALHGHRWVKARVQAIEYCLNIHTLEQESAHQLGPNDLGVVRLELQEPIPLQAYGRSRLQGAMILVDTASHQTSGALWALQKGEALHAA